MCVRALVALRGRLRQSGLVHGFGIGGGIMLLMLAGCARQAPEKPAAPPPPPVKVADVQQRDMPVEVSGLGRVEPYLTVTLRPQVAGQIMEVHFKEGDDVQAGQPLFSLDARPFEAELHQAEGTLARDVALAQDAQFEAQRQEGLREQKITAEREYQTAAAQAAATAAAVQADRAAVEQARLQLDYCTIRAPISGRTGSRLADPGNIVKANETALVTINQVMPIYVSFSVPEARREEIKRQRANGRLPIQAYLEPNEPPESGELTFIDNQVDRATTMILLKGTFANEQRRLWPGQTVKSAVLKLSTRSNAIVVPTHAVQQGQKTDFVYVVKGEQAEFRPVSVGFAVGDLTVIERGVQAGETVITEGQLRVKPGATVAIRSEAGGATSAPVGGAAKSQATVATAIAAEAGPADRPLTGPAQKEGRKEGRQEGRKVGQEEGQEEGQKETRRETRKEPRTGGEGRP